MKQMLVVLTVLLTSASVWAISGSNLVIAVPGEQHVGVVLRRQADYVAIPITISSDQRDPVQRLAEISEARRLIQKKAEGNPDIIVKAGHMTLLAKPISKALTRTSLRKPMSTALLHVFVPIKGTGRDVSTCAAMIQRFLSDVAMPGKASLWIGEIGLAVDNPEQYRPALLQMISDAIAKTRPVLKGQGEAEISGLERPVAVRQVDVENVELFIDYGLAFELTE